MEIIKRPSPKEHFEDRKNGGKPVILVIHYTETIGMGKANDYFLGLEPHPSGGPVSSHYMIDEDGALYQYVEEDKRAYHAGPSYWDGIKDVNSYSIGIENVHPGHKFGYRAFSEAQMEKLICLCKDIAARHGMSPFYILAHSDVAPRRKIDPGEQFDWKRLAENGIGVWPVPVKEDFARAAELIKNEDMLRAALTEYGYTPYEALPDVVEAFQRHFYPEAFQMDNQVGKADEEMAARLNCLVRMKRAAFKI